MFALATVSGPLPKVGVIVVALLVAGVLVASEQRTRALATLGALVLAPVLLLAEIWNSPQLATVHRHPLYAVVGAAVVVVALFALGRLISPGRN